MGTWDVRLISASYVMEGDEPVVELYGKTRGKESITILVHGFRPYLFAVNPTEALERQLSEDQEVVGTEKDTLLYHATETPVLKVTLRSPWKVSEYRNRFRRMGFDTLAADIPLNHRFFYDTDMGSCIRVTGEAVGSDRCTDLTVDMESFENIDSFDPGLRILSFDIENSVEHEFLYCICAVVGEDGEIRRCEPIHGTERDIITGFSDLIRSVDPDVITGYNIDNYDIRKIQERAKANKMKDALPWGRDGGQPRVVSERFWRVKGRLICDAWWAVRKELRPKQETLNAVSMQLLGETKMDVDPRHMDSEWSENRQKVLEYLEQSGLADNTVVVISADHGEEFNDNGDNYWGHNSNFTKYQTQVPLVVHWPGMSGGRTIKERSASYDVSATILPRVFGVTNPLSDFTIGQDLFSLKPRKYILAGSYLENAVIEDDRIVLIDKVGMLQFKNPDYTDSSNTVRSPHLLEALGVFSEYLEKGR